MWIHKTTASECLTDYKFFCFDGILKSVYMGEGIIGIFTMENCLFFIAVVSQRLNLLSGIKLWEIGFIFKERRRRVNL